MTLLAAIAGSAVLSVVLWLVVAGLIFWLVNWLIDYCGVPQPFNKVAKVIVAVCAVVLVINALLMLVGSPFIAF